MAIALGHGAAAKPATGLSDRRERGKRLSVSELRNARPPLVGGNAQIKKLSLPAHENVSIYIFRVQRYAIHAKMQGGPCTTME